MIRTLRSVNGAGSKRLLDIGCATGDFLDCAKEGGYAAEGFEVSRWSAKIARTRGFQVYGEFLDTFVASHKGQYDVVTVWAVIEHFARPLNELQRILQLLKPNGTLALWTGDVSSITSRALGRKWWCWQGQHIQHFTKGSLSRLARMAGFEPVRIDCYPFAATRETLSDSLRRYPALRPFLMAALTPLFWLRPVVYLRLPGEMFFVAGTLDALNA